MWPRNESITVGLLRISCLRVGDNEGKVQRNPSENPALQKLFIISDNHNLWNLPKSVNNKVLGIDQRVSDLTT